MHFIPFKITPHWEVFLPVVLAIRCPLYIVSYSSIIRIAAKVRDKTTGFLCNHPWSVTSKLYVQLNKIESACLLFDSH